MKFVRPIKVDTTTLTATNAAEVETLYNPATAYALAAKVYRVIDGIHQGFESTVGANAGHTPETDDGTHWLATGATNPYKMFDGAIQAQTSRADSLAVTVTVPADDLANCAWVKNINATSLRVQLVDPTDGAVVDDTYDLNDPAGISDYYEWFFEQPVRKRGLFVTGLGNYVGAAITLTLAAAGETVLCGESVVGFYREIGGTQWGAQLGIRDYSVKAEDDFGNLVPVERAYRSTGDFQLITDTDKMDAVVQLLTDFRAKPALIVGDDAIEATHVYGFLQDWKAQLGTRRKSYFSLNVQSLT